MEIETINTRAKAIAWWDTLRSTRLCNDTKDKGYYTDKHFGSVRMYQYLTGREIEQIWEKEIKDK